MPVWYNIKLDNFSHPLNWDWSHIKKTKPILHSASRVFGYLSSLYKKIIYLSKSLGLCYSNVLVMSATNIIYYYDFGEIIVYKILVEVLDNELILNIW